MKQMQTAAILIALVLGGFTSCTKDNSGTSTVSTASTLSTSGSSGTGKTSAAQKGPIATILIDHDWLISSYNGLSQNNTDFRGWNFNYGEMNYIAATYMRNAVYNGTWTLDEVSRTVTFNFGETIAPLTALEASWTVTNASETTVSMQRKDGTATVVFERTVNTQ